MSVVECGGAVRVQLEKSAVGIEIDVVARDVVCFAMEQAGFPIVEGVKLRNVGLHRLEGATVEIGLSPDLGAPLVCAVPALAAGDEVDLGVMDLRLPAGRLRTINETERVRLGWQVRAGDEVLASGERELAVVPWDHWPGHRVPTGLLAAFVTPNDPVITAVLRRVRDHLDATTSDRALSAYQSRSPRRVLATVQALYEVVQTLGISYAVGEPGFEEAGQRVRTAARVVEHGLGNCLDVSVLFASALEQMGLFPLVVMVKGHAFPGVWLIDERFPEQTVYDAARLRTGVALGQLVFFDSSASVSDPKVAFDAARGIADQALADDGRYLWALDVQVARGERYRPLPMRTELAEAPTDAAPEARAVLTEARAIVPHAEPPPPAPPPEPVVARFAKWKEKLLDLSLNNRLLAFRPDAKTVLPLAIPDVARFEDLLAADVACDVLPAPSADARDERDEALVAARVDAADVIALRRADLEKGRVHSPLRQSDMLTRAVALDRAARADVEEGGANTLFAIIGVLRWFESGDSEVERLAPLLMVPVTLEYTRTTRRVRVRRLADDPLANVTLVEKLRRDFGVDLSVAAALDADDSGVDVAKMLTAVRAAIQRVPRWEVREDVFLATLSFSKFLLWRDLDDNAEVLLQNPVVQHIASTAGTAFENRAPEVRPDEVDARPLASMPLVVDADSTQTAAVASALAGRTYVLQGPPGTGKSQTITNLIAAAIGAGKSVLFVAEKMAALEVVHRRLVSVGLGDFCLELHSNKANKRAVVTSLAASLERRPATTPAPWESRCAEVSGLREDLNAYVGVLHAQRPLGMSFYEASAQRLALSGAPEVSVALPAVADTTEAARRAQREAVARLATAVGAVGAVREHPWRDAGLAAWSATREQELRSALDALVAADGRMSAATLALAAAIGARPTGDVAGAEALLALAKALSVGPSPRGATDDAVWASLSAEVVPWIEASERQDARLADLLSRWRPELLDRHDLAGASAAFARWAGAFFLFAWLFLWSWRRALKPAALALLPDDLHTRDDLAVTATAVAERQRLAAERTRLVAWLDGAWDGAGAASLRAVMARGDALRTVARRWRADGRQVSDFALAIADPAVADERRAAVGALAGQLADALAAWVAALEVVESLAEARAPTRDFAVVLARTERWRRNLPSLRPWCLYRSAANAAREAGFGVVVDAVVAGDLLASTVEPAADRAFLDAWLAAWRDAEPALRDFDGANRHRLVERFVAQDRELIALGPREVTRALAQRLPRAGGDVSDASEPGIILRESRKKARHKPIRKLLQELPTLLPRLKPCLLMSPLSVAQYLPASGRRFDLVVFDEASQICTHDAIGALARGEQAIIVGDSKQLPPTAFFQRTQDDAADENDFTELDSILDEAVASGIPQMMLGWHYRSRHESLIAFSNEHYYDGRLNVFPAARGRVADLGVAWHPVPNGVYEKGRTRTNPIEARALVDVLVSSLRQWPAGERTFGVVAFSQAQQTLVADLLDEARRAYPDIEPHFTSAEPVFVKNLENVQGDERDEILFTVGYGPDEAGRLFMNFGPLNREGGERRLNVAVTRARRKLRVFSTLTDDQIDVSRTRARGARHLKEFLRYARVQGAERPQRATGAVDFGSDFERQVYEALVANGWQVDTRVGCGGYRIDLAVVHPDRPGEYLLGIECDGAPYHAAASARDRDRLRQQVLEGLGWRMHRVWSTDWWFDREREMVRLEDNVKWALAEPLPSEREVVPLPVAAAPIEVAPVVLDPPSVRVEPYVWAELGVIRANPDDLFSRSCEPFVVDAVRKVVAIEGPAHVDEVARRVSAAFGVGTLTSRVRRRILEVLERAGIAVHDEFAWQPGATPESWDRFRGAGADGSARDADLIAVEELAAATASVLARNLSLPEVDLHRETARLFGIARLGPRVKAAMACGVDALVARGVARRDGERIVRVG